jgi:hypothetical protein
MGEPCTNFASIRKSDTAEVRVSRDMVGGRRVIDVRVWFLPKDGSEYIASRKGITIDAAKINDLISALQAVAR